MLKPAAVPMLAAAGVDIGGGLVERNNAQAVTMKRCTNTRTNTNTQIRYSWMSTEIQMQIHVYKYTWCGQR